MREEPPPQPPQSVVLDEYMRTINPTPSTTSMRELLAFEGDLGSDVCLRAIDEAVDANARTWKYIRAILQEKKAQGIRSLADWDRQGTSRKASKKAQPCPADYGMNGPVDLGDIDLLISEGLV